MCAEQCLNRAASSQQLLGTCCSSKNMSRTRPQCTFNWRQKVTHSTDTTSDPQVTHFSDPPARSQILGPESDPLEWVILVFPNQTKVHCSLVMTCPFSAATPHRNAFSKSDTRNSTCDNPLVTAPSKFSKYNSSWHHCLSVNTFPLGTTAFQ